MVNWIVCGKGMVVLYRKCWLKKLFSKGEWMVIFFGDNLVCLVMVVWNIFGVWLGSYIFSVLLVLKWVVVEGGFSWV